MPPHSSILCFLQLKVYTFQTPVQAWKSLRKPSYQTHTYKTALSTIMFGSHGISNMPQKSTKLNYDYYCASNRTLGRACWREQRACLQGSMCKSLIISRDLHPSLPALIHDSSSGCLWEEWWPRFQCAEFWGIHRTGMTVSGDSHSPSHLTVCRAFLY